MVNEFYSPDHITIFKVGNGPTCWRSQVTGVNKLFMRNTPEAALQAALEYINENRNEK